MKYTEALNYKKEALKKADESVIQNYHIIITPADTGKSAKYIEDFSKKPADFNDSSCKKYCSNDKYEVVSFKKEFEE
jgi:predicted nucleic-acid-binding protein